MTVKANDIFPALGPVPLDAAHATVKLSSNEFTLWPGQSRTVLASFRPPKGLDASLFPVYSGWIEIASGSDLTHVSYLGLAAELKKKQVLDTTDYLFGFELPVVLNSAGDVQTEPTNYTFVGDDWPGFAFSSVYFICCSVSWLIVDVYVDWCLGPRISSWNLLVQMLLWTRAH